MPIPQQVKIVVYYNDGTPVDITHRLKRGPEISKNKDSDDWEANMTFENTDNQIKQNKSLDPWDENSDYNQHNGEYEPLLAWYHKIKIWANDIYSESIDGGDATGTFSTSLDGGSSAGTSDETISGGDAFTDYDSTSLKLRFEGFCGSGEVRTWIQVAYKDSLSGGAEKLSDPVYDEEAKQKYGIWKGNDKKGHRKMRMVEGNDSWIDTEGEAIDYINSALHDLTVMKPEMDAVISNDRRGEVSLSPYGRSQPYKDDNRLTKYHYENRDLATSLLQSILIDSGFEGRMQRVYIQDDPKLEIGKFTSPNDENTWSTLQRAVKRTGYELTMKKISSGVPYNDGSGEVTPVEGMYLTLLEPDREKTSPDRKYSGAIKERRSDPGRGQTFVLDKDIYDEINIYDQVEFNGQDYTTRLGVTGLSYDWSPGNPYGQTTVKGVADKIIGDSTYWLAKDITEEERNRRRNDFYQGELEKLPRPTNLKARSYPTQGEDGYTVSNIVITWDQPKAWWYDYTAIWISVGNRVRFGNSPYATTKNSHVELKPFPPGEDVYYKVRHIPSAHITSAGRR